MLKIKKVDATRKAKVAAKRVKVRGRTFVCEADSVVKTLS